MRRALSFAALLVAIALVVRAGLVLVPVDAEERDPCATTRVMSFNVRYDNPADGEHRWSVRKERVASTIRFHRADVVGLQEVLHHQLEFLLAALPGYGHVGVGRDDGKEAGEYSPILYRKERFRVLDEGTFWLSTEPRQPGSMGWDAACPRVVTWAHLAERDAGHGAVERIPSDRTLFVVNTHWDHRGADARSQSARLLAGFVERRCKGARVVVTGDMNCTIDSEAMELLRAGVLADAMELSEEPHHGPSGTWVGFQPPREIGRRIDFVLVGGDLRVLRHGVLTDQWDGGLYASDHLPVLVELAR